MFSIVLFLQIKVRMSPIKVTDNQSKIIQLILENNKVSTSEIAEKLGISKRKVLENIKKLKEKNIVQRIGTPKAGWWKINDPF